MILPGLWKLVFRGSRHFAEKGEKERSIRLAAAYARWRPSDPRAWNLLGDSLLHGHKFTEAEAALRKGLVRHRNSPELTYLLCQTLMFQGRLEEARGVLDTQKQLTPDSFFPYLGELKLAEYTGNRTEALKAAKEAAKRIPRNWPWAKYEVGSSLLEVPAGREMAEHLLEEAANSLPRDEHSFAMTQLLLGVLRESRSRREAEKHLAVARRHWKSQTSFDEMLESSRKAIQPG